MFNEANHNARVLLSLGQMHGGKDFVREFPSNRARGHGDRGQLSMATYFRRVRQHLPSPDEGMGKPGRDDLGD